jgi:hypothetical protein
VKALALLLLVACWSAPAPVCPAPITRTIVAPCLTQAPPDPPTPTDDAALNDARMLDYAKKVERYLRLYVLPSCL